jgi:hypothetical protein
MVSHQRCSLLLRIVKNSCGPMKDCRLANVLKMSNIEHFSRFGTLHHVAVKTREPPGNRFSPCLVLLVMQRPKKLVNCIPVPCAPSHTEIGNFPQPRPWKRSRANDNSQ